MEHLSVIVRCNISVYCVVYSCTKPSRLLCQHELSVLNVFPNTVCTCRPESVAHITAERVKRIWCGRVLTITTACLQWVKLQYYPTFTSPLTSYASSHPRDWCFYSIWKTRGLLLLKVKGQHVCILQLISTQALTAAESEPDFTMYCK